jgi:hypothetical protein
VTGLAVRIALALGLVLLAIQQLGLASPAAPERMASLISVRGP